MQINFVLNATIFSMLFFIANLSASETTDTNGPKIVIKDYECNSFGNVNLVVVNRSTKIFKGKYVVKLLDRENDIVWQKSEAIDLGEKNGKKFLIYPENGKCTDKKIQISILSDRNETEGIWENGKLIPISDATYPNSSNNVTTITDRTDIDRDRKKPKEERRHLEEDKKKREQAKTSSRINLQVAATTPTSDGTYNISIQTNADTASLKINGEELGGKPDGAYNLVRVARAGQETKIDITARDVYGNTESKIITVSRAVIDSKVAYAALNPAKIKRQAERDAVAIIIGISDYRNLPKAAHADDDARAFYDYALRALGVKPENIKLLVNQDAGEVEIYKTFKNWLSSKVRSNTEVFVFYSGHGYTTADGKGLYWFPYQADRDLISKTAILVEELNTDILLTKPKSVTIFADACYSGQARSGDTLITDSRPVMPKLETRLFPENFTVITAGQADQISSSSPDLKHGIFSYYLMKGMEGDADANKDGKITLGEMQSYLIENVGRQAGMMSRKQEPQLIGDVNRVLVGK
jgi:hypothetical protein